MPSFSGAQASFNVVPSFKGTQEKVTAGIKNIHAEDIKVKIEVDKEHLRAAEAEAKAASQRLAYARSDEENFTNRVARAEKSLSEARQLGGRNAAYVELMERKLEREKQGLASASNVVSKAHAEEARAKATVVAANDRLAASNHRLSRSSQGIAGAFSSLRSAGSSINAAKREINQADNVLSRAAMSAAKLGAYSTAAASALVGIGGATGPILAVGSALVTAAGAAALIPAAMVGAGASFGAIKLGISGLSEAFKTAGKAADESGQSGAKSAKEQLQRTKSIRDAQEALGKAQQNSARAREDGERRVSDAMRAQQDTAIQGARSVQGASDSLMDARRRAADAERDYNDAVKETVLALRDLKVELKSSSLSVEEAQLALDRAKLRLKELKEAGTKNPLDMREAELSVRRANISLEEAKNRYSDVARQSAEANATGVKGARSVVDAQRNVQDANKGVAKAEESLQLARQDASKANADAARSVSDAQREASRANADAAKQVRDAQERLSDAYAKTGDSANSAGKKASDALAKLSPNAQAFVRSVLGMKNAWETMQRSVQNRLFAGVADEVRSLGTAYIPILARRLGDVAGSFNTAAMSTSRWLRSANGVSTVDRTLQNTSRTADQLARSAAPLTKVFFGFAAIGSEYLTPLAKRFADLADRAAAFVNSAAGVQKIRGWIENGLTAIGQLWSLIKNIGGIIGTVWRTMNDVGATTMQLLVDLTGQANAWVKSAEGQETLKKLFTAIRDVVRELRPGVMAVLGALKDALLKLAPSLPGLAFAFSNIVISLTPLVGPIASGLKWLIDYVLIPFSVWARANPSEMQKVAVSVLAVAAAVKALNVAKKLTDWTVGIGKAFGMIKSDADKASEAVGNDSKSGLRGKLGALGKLAGLAVKITVLIAVMQELGDAGDALQKPVKDIPQKKRSITQEAQNDVGGQLGTLNDNPLASLSKNWGKSPFEWFFGQTPDQFSESVKNSLFSKLNEKFNNTIGAWLDTNVGKPVQGFFANLPASIDTANNVMGSWADANISQPVLNALPTMGDGVRGFFSNLPATISGWNDQLGTWAETNIRQPVLNAASTVGDGVRGFFSGLPATISGWNDALGSWAETNIRQPVLGAASKLGDGVRGFFSNLPATISGWNDQLGTWAETNIRQPVMNAATKLGNGTRSFFANLPSTIASWNDQLGKWAETNIRAPVVQKFTELRDGAVNRVTSARDWVVSRFTDLRDGAINRVTSARDWVVSRLSDLRDGAINRVTAARDWVVSRFTDLRDGAINRITGARDWVLSRFSELRDGAINRVTAAKDWVVQRATELRDGFLDRIHKLVDAVGRKWDELRGFFARPIKWVIDQVWNGTIARLWGKARSLIPALPEFHYLAAGGSVQGAGTATSDSIPAMLSNGEHVVTAREVDAMGGHSYVAAWREAALNGTLPQFATGGPVKWNELFDTVKRVFPSVTNNSNYRPGDPGEHGAGLAVDMGGPMPAIQGWIAKNYPESHELIGPLVGLNRFNGRPHQYNAATTAEHMNHVHWARAEKGKGILGTLASWGADALNAVSSFFRDSMTSIFDGPAGWIRDTIGKMFPGDSLASRVPKDGTNMVLDNVRDFLFGKADAEDALAGGGGIADGGPTTGDMLGNARVIANVGRALGFGRNGVVVALATALQESGLRNLRGGDRDSVGLFQQRPSQGWGSVAQIMNPSYAASKFFNALRAVRGWERLPVTVAAQRVQRSAFPNAYAKWVGKANSLASQVGFSDGGAIPGRPGRDDKFALVQGGERVLSPAQNAWLESALRVASTSPAVTSMQSSRDLAGVGAASKSARSGQLFGDVHIRETVDVDAAMSRAAFLSGSL